MAIVKKLLYAVGTEEYSMLQLRDLLALQDRQPRLMPKLYDHADGIAYGNH